MNAPPLRSTLRAAARATAFSATLAPSLALSLAACSPAGERRAAVPNDTAPASAPSTAAASPLPPAPRAAAAPAADSVRGVVERIGSDPATQLVVRARDGAMCALQMAAPPPIEGLEVALWGRRDVASAMMIPGVSCSFAVERYTVRGVDGIAAIDGVLRAQAGAFALESADGMRRPLRDLPSTLRTQVGARIYWAGPVDRAPAAYGVLVPAR